ncbi:MAG: efflux RND transporter permease subunit [Patescibacteria group bacterium]|jgi:multidrug efflux pump subunit AcrB|nr:efflux RND transporter permease subunit [Patescibacteria group bacterium]
MNNENKKKPHGFAGKLASLFLKNKQLGILTIIVLVFWGVGSFIIMPKQYNPEIVAPAFNIVTDFPGASSNEIYELVTRPMEDKVRELPKVDKVMSQSIDGGRSIVTVQFFIGENLEDAKISLMQKLGSNMNFKPLGASNPIIKEINPDDVPIVVLALTSEKYSEESLRKIAWDLGDRIKMAEDSSKIEIKGGKEKQLTVKVDEDKLTNFQIPLNQVLGAIQKNNTRFYGGSIENESENFRVIVDGNIEGVEDLKNIIVWKDDQKTVYLSDIASISYDTGEVDKFIRFSDRDNSTGAVYLAVAKLKGSNAMTVAKNILKEVDTYRDQGRLDGVKLEVVRNDGVVANEAVMSLTKNLFQAVAIVSFVLLIFLGWKSAAVVAVAIPLTLASVFGIGNLFGQSVNRITLFALILSLGLLVDSATVVVENIYRLLREHPERTKKDVIIEAVDEVGPGLFMSTITTILAFLPMAFVTGMMGPYMGPIPFFVPAALIASLLIAFTINPFLLNLFTKSSIHANVGNQQVKTKKNFFIRLIESVKRRYEKLLKKILDSSGLRRKILATVLVLFLLAVSLPVFRVVKFRMLPKADKEQFYLYLDLPEYTAVEKTNQVSRDIENFLFQESSEIESIQNFIGESQVVDFNGLFKGSGGRIGENQATLKINLTHPDSRKITSEKIVLAIRPDIEKKLKEYPDLRLKIIEDPPGPPVLSTFLIKIQGEDLNVLNKIARDVEHEAFEIEKVVDVDSTINERTFEYVLKVDKEKANLSGLTSEDLASSISMILGESKVGLYHQKDAEDLRKPEQEYIVVNFDKEDRDQKIDLDKIFISNSNGQKVSFSELVSLEQSSIFPTIYSDDQQKTVYVSAEMGARSVTYSMIDAFKFLLDYKLPNETGKVTKWSLFEVNYSDQQTGDSYTINLDGEWKLTLEVFRDLGIAMGVAIFLIYFVLVAQFKSLRVPLWIMGTIPLALIGVLPGFAILGFTNGMFFNATSMIGVIALAGIVVNNAIIFLEYLNELKAKGKEIKEAIVITGKTRFLPILLTSMTTILGSLTIVNDPVWAGLAWSIIWGLSLSSFLTLIIFPIIYFVFERKNWRV